MTAEERERATKKEGLELDRLRITRELHETNSPLRRRSLEAALAFLNGELEKLAETK